LIKKHSDQVFEVFEAFIEFEESDTTPDEIILHRQKPNYGFQTHPEVPGSHGLQKVKNFLGMCGVL
jgi:GMP synthase (glutamine-hydrolysing)